MSTISLLVLVYLLFLLIVVICFSLWVLVIRLLKDHKHDKSEKRRKRFQHTVEKYLDAPSSHIPRMKGVLEGEFREWALLYLAANRNHHLHREDYFLTMLSEWEYLKDVPLLLSSNKLQEKFEGLYIASVFELRQEKEKVIALLQDSHPLIRMKAFWTFGAIGRVEDLQTIVDFLEKENFDFSKIEQIIYVISRLDVSDEQTAYEIFYDCYKGTKNLLVQRCLIELLGKKKLPQSIPFLINMLKHENHEIRIGAIKALIELDAKFVVSEFIKLLDWSESDNVKIIAMKGIATLGGDKYLDTMIKNLEHPIWWVRYYSAFGIARLGGKGRRELRRLSFSYHDKYGRDMANFYLQILEKDGVLWDSRNQTFMIG